MFGTVGLTVIGATKGANRDVGYLGFWIPLKIVASVPRNNIGSNDVVAGQRVWVWPNPFTDIIQVSILHSDVAEASIKLFTLNGEAVGAMQMLQSRTDGLLFQWDGRSFNGNAVAAGTYAARVHLRERGNKDYIEYSTFITRMR